MPKASIDRSLLSHINNKGDDKMSRRSDNQHVNSNPHFDGEKESVLNDPTATAGTKIGIQLNAKEEFAQEKNPFNYLPKRDREMQPFEKLTRGKKVKE